MSNSSLENTKGVHLEVLDNSKHQEDVKLYAQLPDYDNSQGYALGKECILLQVAQRIYANFHKPSWRPLKHHLFSVGRPKKLFGK